MTRRARSTAASPPSHWSRGGPDRRRIRRPGRPRRRRDGARRRFQRHLRPDVRRDAEALRDRGVSPPSISLPRLAPSPSDQRRRRVRAVVVEDPGSAGFLESLRQVAKAAGAAGRVRPVAPALHAPGDAGPAAASDADPARRARLLGSGGRGLAEPVPDPRGGVAGERPRPGRRDLPPPRRLPAGVGGSRVGSGSVRLRGLRRRCRAAGAGSTGDSDPAFAGKPRRCANLARRRPPLAPAPRALSLRPSHPIDPCGGCRGSGKRRFPRGAAGNRRRCRPGSPRCGVASLPR